MLLKTPSREGAAWLGERRRSEAGPWRVAGEQQSRQGAHAAGLACCASRVLRLPQLEVCCQRSSACFSSDSFLRKEHVLFFDIMLVSHT